TNCVTGRCGSFAIGGDYTGAGGHTTNVLSNEHNPTLNSGSVYTDPDNADPNSESNATINAMQGLGAVDGRTTSDRDPGNLVNGKMYQVERDITIKDWGGLPLVFERFYNSRDKKNGPLGYGWTHSFNHYLVFKDDNADSIANGQDTD